MVQDILLCFASRIASLFQHPSWSSASKSSEDNSVESQHRIATSADPKEMWVVCLMTAKSRATMVFLKPSTIWFLLVGPQSLQPWRSLELTAKKVFKAYSQGVYQSLRPRRSSELTAKDVRVYSQGGPKAYSQGGPQSLQQRRSSKLTAIEVLKAYSQGGPQSLQPRSSSELTT
ncbi:hypothetical protein BgiMline_011946 [Biomphalaria glabrata]|nr:hypothetical protein BgiMline_030554 [Biomphalaria glabrata]